MEEAPRRVLGRRCWSTQQGCHKQPHKQSGPYTPHHLLKHQDKKLKKFIHQFQHILSLSDVTRESLYRYTWVQDSTDHSREDHHKQWQKFKIARQNRSAFCVSQVLSTKRSLNNHLKQYREMVKDILHSFISAGFSVQ